jgi:phage gp16-like protein
VIEHLRRHGFQRTTPREVGAAPVVELREAHHRMARGLWIDLHRQGVVRDGSDRALNHFTARVTKVAALGWTDASQANQVIEALKAMARRARV